MAINFDRIPTENPFTLPEPGIYRARIAEAKMTPSKTPGKPPYIAVKYELLDKFGKKLSTVYDNIVESDRSSYSCTGSQPHWRCRAERPVQDNRR